MRERGQADELVPRRDDETLSLVNSVKLGRKSADDALVS